MAANENIGGIQVNISANTEALNESLSKAGTKVKDWAKAQNDRKINLTVGAKINEASVNKVREQLTAIQQEFTGTNPIKIKIDASFKVNRNTMIALQRDINTAAQTYKVKVNVLPNVDKKNPPTLPVKAELIGWVGQPPVLGVKAEMQGNGQPAGTGANKTLDTSALAVSFGKDIDRVVRAINECCAMGGGGNNVVEPPTPTQPQSRQRTQPAATEPAEPTPAKRARERAAARETGEAVAQEIKESPVKTEKAPKEKAEEKKPVSTPKPAPSSTTAKPKFANVEEYIADPANQTAIKAGKADEAMLRRVFAMSQEAAAEAAQKEEALASRQARRAQERPASEPAPATKPKRASAKTSAKPEEVAPAADYDDAASAWMAGRGIEEPTRNPYPGVQATPPEQMGQEWLAQQQSEPTPRVPRDDKSLICSCHGRVFNSVSGRKNHERAEERKRREESKQEEPLSDRARDRLFAERSGIFEELPGYYDEQTAIRLGRLINSGLDPESAELGYLKALPGREAELEASPDYEPMRRDLEAAMEARRASLKSQLAYEETIDPKPKGLRAIRRAALEQAVEDPTTAFAEQQAARLAREEMLAELGVSEEARSGFSMRDLKAAAMPQGEFDPGATLPIPGTTEQMTAGELLARNRGRYERQVSRYEAAIESSDAERQERLLRRYRSGGQWNFGGPLQDLQTAFDEAEDPKDIEKVARQAFRMSAEQRHLYSAFDLSKMTRDAEKQGIDLDKLLATPTEERSDEEKGFIQKYYRTKKRDRLRAKARFQRLFDPDRPRGGGFLRGDEGSSDEAEVLSGLDIAALQTRGIGEIGDVLLTSIVEPQKNAVQSREKAEATIEANKDVIKSGTHEPSRSEKIKGAPGVSLGPLEAPKGRVLETQADIERGVIRAASEAQRLAMERERAEALRAAGHDPLESSVPRTPNYTYAMESEGDRLEPQPITGMRGVTQNPEQIRAEAEAARAAAEQRRRDQEAEEEKTLKEAAKAGRAEPKFKPFVPPERRQTREEVVAERLARLEERTGPFITHYSGSYNPEAYLPPETPIDAGLPSFDPYQGMRATPGPSYVGAGGGNDPASSTAASQGTRHCEVCNKEISVAHWGRHENSAGHQNRLNPSMPPAPEAGMQGKEPTKAEIDRFIRNTKKLGAKGDEIPTRAQAKEYLQNRNNEMAVRVPVPEGDVTAEFAQASVPPPNEVAGMGGGGGAPINVFVTNWPSGFGSGTAGALDIDEIRRKAAADQDFAKRMIDAGILKEEELSARQKKGKKKTVEEEAEEVAAEAETKARRKGAPTRSQISRQIGEVNFGQLRAKQQDDYEDMLDVVQDQQNFAREVLEENPVRALSVAVSQVAVNMTGRAELKNAITGINRAARRANRFATDANEAMANMRGAEEALTDPNLGDEDKARFTEAVETYRGLYEQATANYERIAGIPFKMAERIAQETHPKQREQLVREAERAAMEQDDEANPQSLFGRTGFLRQQRMPILARTALVGTAGIVGGTALFTVAMTAFNAAMKHGAEWVGRVSDEMSGFAQQANMLASSLAQGALPTGRLEGGVRERLGMSGIGGDTADQLTDAIASRIGGEVAAQRMTMARDTFALAGQQMLLQAQHPGIQNFAGNFQPTGGMVLPLIGQTNIGAQASVQETIASMVGDMPSRTGHDFLFSARENPLLFQIDNLLGRKPQETFDAQDQLGREITDQLTGAIRRGGGTGAVVNEQLAGTEFSNEDQLTQARAVIAAGGSPDLARRINSGDIALVDANGDIITSAKGVAQALDQLGTGLQTVDLEQLLKAGARQLEAAFYGISRNLQNQLQTWGPIGTAMQLAQAPRTQFGLGVSLANASPEIAGQALGNRMLIGSAIDRRAERGRNEMVTMAAQFGGQVGVSPSQLMSTFDEINRYGDMIVGWQTQIAEMQLGQQMVEYNRQVFVAERNISDLRGLVHGVGDAHASNIGVLQKENLMRQRQIQDIQRVGEAEGLALNQRQINFQLAMSKFATPGMTPGEAAAQVKQAQLEAEYAQRQQDRSEEIFDITGEMIPAERKIIDEQNLRALEDALAEFQIFQDRFTLDQDTKLVADNIALAQQHQAGLASDMQAMLGALQQAQSTQDQLTQDAYLKGAETLKDTADAVKEVYEDVSRSFRRNWNIEFSATAKRASDLGTQDDYGTRHATGWLGNVSGATNMTVGEAGMETVAILRNPRKMSMGGGGGNFILNINNPVVRDETDIDTLARRVSEIFNRQSRLYGL